MITSAMIPVPLARLPWRLIWLVALICTIGVVTLYSAAGGSMSPWALKQGVIIIAFALMAVAISYIPESFVKQVTFPTYVVIMIMLIAVEMVGFVGKGARRFDNGDTLHPWLCGMVHGPALKRHAVQFAVEPVGHELRRGHLAAAQQGQGGIEAVPPGGCLAHDAFLLLGPPAALSGSRCR